MSAGVARIGDSAESSAELVGPTKRQSSHCAGLRDGAKLYRAPEIPVFAAGFIGFGRIRGK